MGCGHSNNSFTQAKNAEEIIALISNVKEPYDKLLMTLKKKEEESKVNPEVVLQKKTKI